MIARKWMLGTAAAAMVAATPLANLPQTGFIATATAASDVDVRVDFNLFYDRLAPYGEWVSYESAYVWVPADISADWRPYTRGHWEYTREYGWLWVSDEPFGWATYHYGRWGFAEDIGWYWVPARRWAPAWVAWRRSDNYLAWAPLPPDDGVRVSVDININVDRVPDNYWIAVETDRFLDRDIAQFALFERRIIEDTRPVGTVVVQNNTVINNVIEVNDIEKQTNQRVAVRETRTVNNPERTGKIEGDAVDIFKADIPGDEKTMKPKKARQAREVVEERKTRRVKKPEENTGMVPQTGEKTTDTKKERKVTPEDSTGNVTPPPKVEPPVPAKRKKKLPYEEGARKSLPDEPTGSVTGQQKEKNQPSTRKQQPDERVTKKKPKKCDPSQEDCG